MLETQGAKMSAERVAAARAALTKRGEGATAEDVLDAVEAVA
jgi:hypothetical protein